MQKILILIFLYIQFIGFTFAQQFSYKNYTFDNGLASQKVYKIYQDKKQFIWFSTDNGISKFDGRNFTNYKIKNKNKTEYVSFFFENDTTIWLFTLSNNLYYYKNNKILKYNLSDRISKLLPKNKIPQKVKFNNNNFEFYYRNIKYVISENINLRKEKISYLISSSVKYLDNTCYIAKEAPRQLSVINLSDGEENKYDFNFRITCLKSSDNMLLIGTLSNGLKIIKNKNFKDINSVLNKTTIFDILIDNEKGVWVATANNGVFYFPNLRIYNYTPYKKEIYNQISCIYPDSNNIIWIGTNYGEIGQLKASEFRTKKIKDADIINKIYVSNKYQLTYIFTEKKIILYNNKTDKTNIIYNYKNIASYCKNYKKPLLFKNGKIYFTDDSKVYQITKDKLIEKYNLTDIDNKITAFDIYNNTLVFSTDDNEVYKLKNKKYINQKIKFNDINDIKYISDSLLIISSDNSGILLITNKNTNVLSTDYYLSNNSIVKVIYYNNNLWIATKNGLTKVFLDKKFAPKYSIKLNKTSGLIYNIINDMYIQDSTVYVSTNKGISVLKENYFTKQILKAPNIYITNIKINNKPVDVTNYYVLSNKTNSFEIDFSTIKILNNNNIQVFFKISELDNLWHKTNNNNILLSNLSSGYYHIFLKTVSYNNIQSDIKEITIKVKKNYYQRFEFYILILIIITIIFYILYKKRIKTIREQQEIKKNLETYQYQALNKQMNPHFIFNSLNSIQNYILQNDIKNSNKYLSKFSRLMRLVLDNTQSNIITINKEIDALKLYLDLEKIRFENRFDYEINIDNELDILTYKIPPLLLQPFVENAIWHGLMNMPREHKGKITINIKQKNENIILEIIDNGIGRKKAEEINRQKINKSLGTKINKNRADLFNDIFKLKIYIKYVDMLDTNNRPKGTKVVIKINSNYYI